MLASFKNKTVEDKKAFLLDLSKIYRELTDQTDNNCLRRFLAFKVILNCMSFEDLVSERKFSDVRPIRDVFLAHRQCGEFFDAFNACEIIKSKKINELISFMEDHMSSSYIQTKELNDNQTKLSILALSNVILDKFSGEFYSGFRLSNNFLCSEKNQIKEISSNPVSSVFYIYNSSKELSILAKFFITNLTQYPISNLLQNSFKIDYILHAVNMCDCIFKDYDNRYSIDGLHEAILNESVGDISSLNRIKNDNDFWSFYKELRWLRNKLAGHMDKRLPLKDLITRLEGLDFNKVFNFVNLLDKSVWESSITHIALRIHYYSFNQKIEDRNIIEMKGLKNSPYFDKS